MSAATVLSRTQLREHVARFAQEAADARTALADARAAHAALADLVARVGPFALAENAALQQAATARDRAERLSFEAEVRLEAWELELACYAPPDARVLALHSIREAEYIAANARARERTVKLDALHGVLASVLAAHAGRALPGLWRAIHGHAELAATRADYALDVQFVEDPAVDGVYASLTRACEHAPPHIVIRLPPGHPCASAGESGAPADPSHPA